MSSVNKHIRPTLGGLLGLPPLQLQLPHDRGGGGDGGGRRQDGGAGRHGGGDLLGSEAPTDQLKADGLAGVSEQLHRLLIGVSLDVHAVHLQGAIIHDITD